MVNRLEMQNTIQQNLNDALGIYFDQTSVLESLQDGYDEILLNSQCYEATTNITFVNGQLYYDLYNTIPGFWRITRIFNKATNRWVPVIDSRFLDKYRFDWEASNGTPWFAYIVNYQYLSFFPHYKSGAGLSFDLFYKVAKDNLTSDTQILQIPDPFNRTIENWCTADLLDSQQEFQKSQQYWQDYEAELSQLKTHVASRMKSDLMMQLNDLEFPMPSLP
jgi:hypothetical protein